MTLSAPPPEKPSPKPGKSLPRKRHRRWPANGRPRKKARRTSTLEILDGLLAQRKTVSVNDEAVELSAIQEIMLHLVQKSTAGSARASRALLKFQAFAEKRAAKSTQIKFVESEYTRSFSPPVAGGNDG